MIDNRWGRIIVALTLIVVVALFIIGVKEHFGYTPDDTYIYLQYAKNIINGSGISFNSGEQTYGITSPLWLFIISLSGGLGIDLYLAAKGIDLIFACLALFILFLLMYDINKDTAVALCTTMAFSLNVWFLRWSGTGMETSFALFLLLITMRYSFQKKYFLSAIIAALLTMVRPEAWVLILLIITSIFFSEVDWKSRIRQALFALFLYLGVLLPWLVYAYLSFETIIPNTALAKAGLAFRIDDGLSTSSDIIKTIIFSDGISILFFLIGGVILFFTERNLDDLTPSSRSRFVGIGFIIMLPLFFIVTGVNVVSRYLLLITPIILVFAYEFLYRIISASALKKYAYLVIFIFTAGIMLQSQFVYHTYVKPGIETFEKGMEMSLIPIGKWLKQYTPPESKIFAQDVGAIGYFSDRQICDAAGLVSPPMLSLLRNGYTHEQMMKDKIYQLVCDADYIVYRSFTPEDIGNDPDLVPLFTRAFPQMGLAENRINYYTVYKVRRGSNINKQDEK